jgi:hypothetical protein
MPDSYTPIEGGLYIVPSEDRYGILKVLKVEDDIVHIRLYKNKFTEVPGRIDTSTLTLGTIFDKDGFGMGHTPLSLRTFISWRPQFLQPGLVGPEELEGYEEWKRANGGVWD